MLDVFGSLNSASKAAFQLGVSCRGSLRSLLWKLPSRSTQKIQQRGDTFLGSRQNWDLDAFFVGDRALSNWARGESKGSASFAKAVTECQEAVYEAADEVFQEFSDEVGVGVSLIWGWSSSSTSFSG